MINPEDRFELQKLIGELKNEANSRASKMHAKLFAELFNDARVEWVKNNARTVRNVAATVSGMGDERLVEELTSIGAKGRVPFSRDLVALLMESLGLPVTDFKSRINEAKRLEIKARATLVRSVSNAMGRLANEQVMIYKDEKAFGMIIDQFRKDIDAIIDGDWYAPVPQEILDRYGIKKCTATQPTSQP